MSDTPKTWKQFLAPYAVRAVVALAAALAGAVGTWLGVPPQVVETIKEVPAPREVAPLDEWGYAPTQGWYKDDAAIAANRDEDKTLHFHNTPAGKVALGDEDVFLYRAVRKAGKFEGTKYPNVNQLSVGCCVGCGFKHGCDVVQATAILAGKAFDWKPVSVEVIYAGSRVEVGGGRISGDGSVGAWAKEYVSSKGGMLSMEKHGAHDLTQFSPARARAWGRTGVPDELEPVAKQYPVKSAALVTSARDAKRALQQGYPVAVCSDQGFRMERDRDGFCAPQGTWYHCMCFIGYRNGARPGFLCLNSWGDSAHTGPVWPADMPPAAFWVDEAVADRMLRQGDSFALADVQGFPVRRIPLNWEVRAVPKREPFDVFARDDRFALAP